MNEDFLQIVSRFAEVETRFNAAKDLAAMVHAEEVLCFLFDPHVHTFLPAPGFPLTPGNTKEWQRFLQSAQGRSYYREKIILPGKIEKDVVSISSNNGCILALINYKQNDITFTQFQTIFVLISALIKTEALNIELESKLKIAEQSSGKSEQLTKYLDNVRAKLHQALKTEDGFLSVASHELKTPVTSISAFIQILLNVYPEASEEKQTHYILKRTKFQVDRLIRLMGDLLDATKIKSGKLDLNIEEIGLDKIIDELIRDYSLIHTSHTIIRKGFSSGKVRCDKSRIEQVITNLLDNAIKYSPTADNIIITTGTNEHNVLFSVQDFGIGIEAESKNKIFDRFFRAHGEDSGNLSSLGLGLYISADIIQRHNGKIWVDSEPGRGSTFHFSLPVEV